MHFHRRICFCRFLRSKPLHLQPLILCDQKLARLGTLKRSDDPLFFLVSNGIQEIRENGFGRDNIPAMMAAVCVISAPLIVLFLIFRKKIMAGVAQGGTKG